jgi:hypothetical protein
MLLNHVIILIIYPLTLCCGFGLCKRWLTGSTQLRDEALRQWQADFNQEVEELGIYCKTRGHGVLGALQGGETRVTYNWVEFAFTPASIASLKAKPHLTGVVYPDGDCSCCHIDEDGLCAFPKHRGISYLLLSDWITRFVCGGYWCLKLDCRSALRSEGNPRRSTSRAHILFTAIRRAAARSRAGGVSSLDA